MELVLIKTFTYSYETTNAIGILEMNDIVYHLQESTISNTFDYLGQGTNGIKLFVSKEDETHAKKLLLDAGILQAEDLIVRPINMTPLLGIALVIAGIIIALLLWIYWS